MPAGAEADPVVQLRERLQRHTPERHPLQHATAQFHLGGLLLARGMLDEAEASFATAAALFRARGARPEEAKALNGLGATLRASGRSELAARALAHAAAGFEQARLPLDEGAARFNLGLVLREGGRAGDAATALGRAVELLDPAVAPGQAAAAARELGATRLALGDLDGAAASLTDAMALADRVGDHAARGAAANTLGLAHLAAGRAGAAADAFRAAVAANPRGVRPEAFGMAKANLALACERLTQPAAARLAARQALAAPVVAEPVRSQAAGVLARLGAGDADVATVLEAERRPEARERLVREELLRSADADDGERAADMRAWIAAHVGTALEPVEVAELWLGGLLELPPEGLERIVRSSVEAAAGLDPDTRETFREAVVRAMARFHVPQWMRLQDVFARAAADAGDPGSWR